MFFAKRIVLKNVRKHVFVTYNIVNNITRAISYILVEISGIKCYNLIYII